MRVEYHLAIQRERNPLCSVDIHVRFFSRARKKHAMFQSGNGVGLYFSYYIYLGLGRSVGSLGGKKGKLISLSAAAPHPSLSLIPIRHISRRQERISPPLKLILYVIATALFSKAKKKRFFEHVPDCIILK